MPHIVLLGDSIFDNAAYVQENSYGINSNCQYHLFLNNLIKPYLNNFYR